VTARKLPNPKGEGPPLRKRRYRATAETLAASSPVLAESYAGQSQILKGMAADAPLEETLSALARLVESSCPGALCTILLLDQDGIHVRHGAAPSLPSAFVEAIDGQEIGPMAGSCGTAMFRGEPVVVTDIPHDPLWAEHKHLAALAGVHACWSTPILSGDRQTLGSFAVYYRKSRPPDVAHREAVGIATYLAGIAIQRDQAARRVAHSERAFRESEARYRSLFESAPDGILVADSAGTYVDANPSGLKMLGYSRDELVGMTSADILAPKEHSRVDSALAEINEGTEHRREWRFRRKDGSGFDADVMATAMADGRILALVRDATERKLAVEELRESERRFRDMLANLHLLSLMLDREGRITHCNEYLLRLTGWTADEVLGRSWFEVFVPAAQQEVRDVLSALLADRPEAWHHENEILTRAGARRLIRWNNSVLRSRTGEAIGMASIGEDITEQKRLEEQLRQSQKMEAIGRLAGGIAHDFNNILGVITGYGEMLRGKTPGDHPDRRRIEQIVLAAERAAGLTHQLLAFSRKQVLEPKVLEPSAVIGNMRKMLERLIGEDIDFVLKADAAGRVKVDPGQLEQVLMNLAVNARDAMPLGGSLRIETSDVDLDQEAAERREGFVQPGRYVMIAVADTGGGMDEATQAKVFEPFFTTKGEGKGTGLGLATVYGIVEQSGGNIWLGSEVGKGTTFRVYLPRVEEAMTEERSRAVAARRMATETVLVVEDEPAARELVGEILREEGYGVLLAEDGLQAVESAKRAVAPIHLVLTDVILPKISGRVAVERIRAIHPRIKVIYMSGYTDDQVSRHGVLEPGIVLLQKPFTPADLTRRVGEVLDGSP
jgi:PAS domain S-box-containing protein